MIDRSWTVNSRAFNARELDFAEVCSIVKIPVPSTILGYLHILSDAANLDSRRLLIIKLTILAYGELDRLHI